MAAQIFDIGLRRLIVVHFPEGAFAVTAQGRTLMQPSLDIDRRLVVGTAGAGDAFCAGVLYALRLGLSLDKVLRAGVCAGALNLFALTTTEAMGPWCEVDRVATRHRFRTLDEAFED
jgi:sugar/nucleoside kinase (ribokinase family)